MCIFKPRKYVSIADKTAKNGSRLEYNHLLLQRTGGGENVAIVDQRAGHDGQAERLQLHQPWILERQQIGAADQAS